MRINEKSFLDDRLVKAITQSVNRNEDDIETISKTIIEVKE